MYTEVQDVVDFLLGYGKHLEFLGFTYNTFNKDLEEIENWRLSCKEFMFSDNTKLGRRCCSTVSLGKTDWIFKDFCVVDDIITRIMITVCWKQTEKDCWLILQLLKEIIQMHLVLMLKIHKKEFIYLKIPYLQTEHAVVLDNETVLGDKIYNRASKGIDKKELE